MKPLSEQERRRILESPPRGTWALLLLFAALLTTGWAILYFGVFLAHGPVS
jgi:hypothetical protein|nr:hypothetical protein [Gammaproteobacteria bacterium]